MVGGPLNAAATEARARVVLQTKNSFAVRAEATHRLLGTEGSGLGGKSGLEPSRESAETVPTLLPEQILPRAQPSAMRTTPPRKVSA